MAGQARRGVEHELANGESPPAVCALPPRGPSAAEFLGRWEAADHYGYALSGCVRRHSLGCSGRAGRGGNSP